MEIKFHGQSCFELSDGGKTVLTDPFLKPNNPVAVATAEEVAADVVAVSHGHADHVADAVAVTQRTGAELVAIVELADWFAGQGVASVKDPNFGGTVSYDWGSIKYVPAWHTNTAPDGTVIGPPAGMVIRIGDTTVYHAGDTCLFSDMMLIAECHQPDVFLVPIGGHYTMDRHDAVRACKLVGAATVIPMHYNTFPPIETDAEAFKADVESQTASKVVVLQPGQSHTV
ncbi:MAG: metal-dependent hydrolase [Actinobacteria bacterium]|nr:metal-dependent hydrolase [Actinomycetota bacterium]